MTRAGLGDGGPVESTLLIFPRPRPKQSKQRGNLHHPNPMTKTKMKETHLAQLRRRVHILLNPLQNLAVVSQRYARLAPAAAPQRRRLGRDVRRQGQRRVHVCPCPSNPLRLRFCLSL